LTANIATIYNSFPRLIPASSNAVSNSDKICIDK